MSQASAGDAERLSPNAEFLFTAIFKPNLGKEEAQRFYPALRHWAETKKVYRERTFTKEEVEEVIRKCERRYAASLPSVQAAGKGKEADCWWPRWVLDAKRGVEVLAPAGPGKPAAWSHATGLGIGYHGQKKRYLFVRSPRFEMDCRRQEVRMPGGGKTVDALLQELLARGEDPSCHPEWTDGSDVKPLDPKKSTALFVSPGVAPESAAEEKPSGAELPRRDGSAASLVGELENDSERMALLRRSSVVKIKTSDHPDPLTEPRTVASIKMPALTHQDVLGLPQACAESKLSSLQLETVCYAARRFRTTLPDGRTAGYLLGDGTGCGKGRCIAALIYHMWNMGHRRSIWVSATSDLYYDAVRDLQDLGADIPCMPMRKLPPSGPLDRKGSEAHLELTKNLGVEGNGVIFLTYSLLVQTGQRRQVFACPVRNEENRRSLLGELLDDKLRCVRSVEEFGDDKSSVHLRAGDRVVGVKKLQDLMALAVPFTVTFERVLTADSKGKGGRPASTAEPDKGKPEKAEPEGVAAAGPEEQEASSEWTPWNSRLGQLVSWLGGSEATGLICFDEVHKAKNLFPDKEETASTKTGLFVDLLQSECPRAPVLYVSATAATEVEHLGYMSRLGAWGPGSAFESFHDFGQAIVRNGVAAMEMFAINMKSIGALSCRALGYTGTQFDTQVNGLTAEQTRQYNAACEFWHRLFTVYQKFTESKQLKKAYAAKWKFKNSKTTESEELGLRVWQAFWGAQQRFFKATLNSFKVPACAAVAREAVARGEQVVISIWATGEARSKQKLEKMKEETVGRVLIEGIREGGLVRVRVADRAVLEKLKEHLNALTRLKNDVTISGTRIDKGSALFSVHGQKLARVEDLPGASVPVELVFRAQATRHLTVDAVLPGSGGKVTFELRDDSLGERVIVGKVLEDPGGSDSFRRAELEQWHVKTINGRPVGKVSVQAIRSRLKPGQHLAFQDPVIPEHLSGPQMVLEHFVKSQLLTQGDDGQDLPWAVREKEELLEHMRALTLPPNAMDELVDQLGGSRKVAELSGRSHRMKRRKDGSLSYVARAEELRCPLHGANLVEQVLFQKGVKQVCVVTEVASAGISLHADRRQVRKDFQPPRRILISLELPWGADKAIQVFGRVHRANQLVPPRFVMLCTPLGGEVRFISSIARRMKLMGAVTKGDRLTCMGGEADRQMAEFDVNNRYGVRALLTLYSDTTTAQGTMAELLGLYKDLPFIGDAGEGEATGRWRTWEDFRGAVSQAWRDMQLHAEFHTEAEKLAEQEAKGASNLARMRVSSLVTRFLNRILMLDVDLQNAIFEAFFAIYTELVRVEKANGSYDDGIQNLNEHQGRRIKAVREDSREVLYTDPVSGAETCHVCLSMDKGIDWEGAKEAYESLSGKDPVEGFYAFTRQEGEEPTYHLVRELQRLGGAGSSGTSWSARRRYKQYIVWRPDEGAGSSQLYGYGVFSKEAFTQDDRYEKLGDSPESLQAVEKGWTAVYTRSVESRLSRVHVLTGDVLTAWRLVNASDRATDAPALQIVRAVTQPDDMPVVGMQVAEESLPHLRYVLSCQQDESSRELAAKGSGPAVRDVALKAAELLLQRLAAAEGSLPCSTWVEVHKLISEDPRVPRSVVGLRGTQVATERLEKKGFVVFEGGALGLKGSSPPPDGDSLEVKLFPEEFDLAPGGSEEGSEDGLDDDLDGHMEELLENDGIFGEAAGEGGDSGDAAGAPAAKRPRRGRSGVAEMPTPAKARRAMRAVDTGGGDAAGAEGSESGLQERQKKRKKDKKEKKKDKKDKKDKKEKKDKKDKKAIKDKLRLKPGKLSPQSSQKKMVMKTMLKHQIGKLAKAKAAAPAPTKIVTKTEEDYEPVNRWWELADGAASGKRGAKKWDTFEHHGLMFAPDYEPHGVPIKYDGKEIKLTGEAEEIATYWCGVKGTDYEKKDLFINNFWGVWKAALGNDSPIKELKKCDFGNIVAHLEEQRRKKREMSKEEKEKISKENNKKKEWFSHALVNNIREKLGAVAMEPPQLFRGRGEHPKQGLLKRRTFPEACVLNIGEMAPVPKVVGLPGHAWKDVVHENTVQWIAAFDDALLGETKYVSFAATSGLKGQPDMLKYDRARRLLGVIDKVRNSYEKLQKSSNVAEQQKATATYFIDKLALRVGGEKNTEEEADTVGCCSLRVEHLTLEPPNTIQFDFLGKDSIRYFNAVQVTDTVYNNVSNFMKGKKPTEDVFDKVDPSIINEYFKEFMDDLTAKVFRTFNASYTLQQELDKFDYSKKDQFGQDQLVKFYNDANRSVAILCNHQRAESKTHGAAMEKMQKQKEDIEKQIKLLKRHMASLEKGETPKPAEKPLPRDIIGCKKKIAETKMRLEKHVYAMTEKEDNKTVSLGTSKVNYMDPRITVAFCKKADLAIEKVFPRTVRTKFPWAMHFPSSYVFD